MTPTDPIAPMGRLAISDVARLAGVTTRAVRHYHAMGLLPEPSRDGSGYRRYDAEDVIAVVRVARLRALGMPIPQIVSHVGSSGTDASLSASLLALAGELDNEIERLAATRDRLREIAGSETFARPAATLEEALRGLGSIRPDDELAEDEASAASLLDALHPGGMQGVLDQAEGLLADPSARAQLDTLLLRFRGLAEDACGSSIDSLAQDVASALPRPKHAAPSVDLEMMDKLLGDRLNAAQHRFMHILRQKLAGNDG